MSSGEASKRSVPMIGNTVHISCSRGSSSRTSGISCGMAWYWPDKTVDPESRLPIATRSVGGQSSARRRKSGLCRRGTAAHRAPSGTRGSDTRVPEPLRRDRVLHSPAPAARAAGASGGREGFIAFSASC